MLLTRLFLRNYRVYEGELELDLPPGLVGIYGANGAGKSTLLEAISWTLFGRARTGNKEVRSAGVNADCVAELELEHEGHLYVVRRRLTGLNCAVKADASCDGLGVAEGVVDTRRYVQSILGMDDAAFRASVFAEQKQIAAFSGRRPEERRELVLRLLGITPLDRARDTARKDAREREGQLTQLRGMLPDLDALVVAAADAEAAAGALDAEASGERAAVDMLTSREGEARAAWEALDRTRQAYDGLVVEGRAARETLDREVERVEALTKELEQLADAAGELAAAEVAAAGLAEDRARLAALRAALDALHRLERATTALGPEPPLPDALATEAADAAARAQVLAEERAGAEALSSSAAAERDGARQRLERSGSLSEEADCPLCGQALGEAFAAVQIHRRQELDAAEQRVADLTARCAELRYGADRAGADADAAGRAHREAAERRHRWELASAGRAEAERSWEAAAAALGPAEQRLTATGLAALAEPLATAVLTKEEAARAADRTRGRLERRPQVDEELVVAKGRLEASRSSVEALRERVRQLAFDQAALDEAAAVLAGAGEKRRAADERARAAELQAAAARSAAEGEARRLADGRAQHARLAELHTECRHRARVAELLSEFRNTVVATVGPRLAAQATELFGELTDREYDEITVDPDSYELQITDHGVTYGLDRFSGSEVDLANLALRVAISEHVRFQSGGTVVLLVLDEVFGPLDEDRKTRMLQALESLRGRFRQVLVVTHDPAIKEQLPNAIEVVKLPGRRATAGLIG